MKTRTILLGVMLLSLFCVIAVPMQAQTANPQETLNQYLADLQKNPSDTALRGKIIALVQSMNPAPATPEDAERHMARGQAAFKAATNESGFKEAIAEFKQASLLAPWLGNIYYNLGLMQDKAGSYADAIANLNLYLLASPGASDTKSVKNLIYEVEYRRDKAQRGQELLKALRNRDIPGALALLDKGADVNVENISGDTPLKLAVGIDRIDIVRTLLDKGADVDASAGGLSPLMIAGMSGYADIVRLLIDKGANVNKADNWGGTVLKWASCGGFASGANPEIVRMLINKGADLNARIPRFTGDAQGNSLLSLVTPSTGYLGTACGKNQEIADILREAGAR